MKRFWKLYKRTIAALEVFRRLRPNQSRQLIIIDRKDYDTIILPAIVDLSGNIQLHTNSTAEEYKAFRLEITKIENFNKKVLDKFYETTKHTNKVQIKPV